MKNIFFKTILPHLLAIGAFCIISFVYFSPVLTGKSMVQNDVIQSAGALKEVQIYQEKTGEEILWSNSTFSGMPVWSGFGSNIINPIHRTMVKIFPLPVLLCLLSFIGFYILLLAFDLNPWLSFAGGIAYAFSSFNIISIEAGHINKVLDMAFMAPVLAGIVLTFRGKYWIGAAVTIISTAMQINYGHIQITYYLVIIILFYGIAEFIYFLKNKQLKDFFKAVGILVICAIIGVGPNFSRLYTNAIYVKSTPRGGSELSAAPNKGGGLEKEYALKWSNGVLETMTLFIPSFYGGSSNEDVGQNSECYKALVKQGYPAGEAKKYTKGMPLYWGDQPFTSGPIYVGAIICFLFVLGLILIKDRIKWWILGVSILAIMLSWGKNFELLTDFFFYNVPLYNKFRSVTMTLSIVQVTFALLAFIVLKKIIDREISKNEVLKGLKFSVIITGGLALLLTFFGGAFFGFTAASDESMPEWLTNALSEDRASALRSDAFRSLIFVLLAAGLVWAFIADKLKPLHLYIAFAILILADLWTVDKRYLNKDDFKVLKGAEKKAFVPTPEDELILQDKDPYYRVFNLTVNPFADAKTSYYHKSIGGYSAIKLGRYQELIDSALSRNNMAVLNMLNTRYFIVPDEKTKQPVVQRNPGALGNAWFVDSIKVIKNADEEINAVKNLNPSTTAVTDQKFQNYLKGFVINKDNSGSIQLTSYHPNRLSYESKASSEQFVVFSDIYYQPGWNAYIDKKPTDHIRVNYVLRGMRVPAGTHTIEFKFEPEFYFNAEKVSFAGSIVWILSLILIMGRQILVTFKSKKL